MKVHAFLRNATEKPVIDFHGHMLSFKANEHGHVVCDVPDEIAEQLLEVAGCGLREYAGPTAGAVPVKTTKAAKNDGDKPGQFVITPSDGPAVDLGAMSDAEVRAFAEQEGLDKPHHTKKGDALRLAVIEALKAQ